MKMAEVAAAAAPEATSDGFVTVVEVSNNNGNSNGTIDLEEEEELCGEEGVSFVTVVEVESTAAANCEEWLSEEGVLTRRQEVVMYRLPCERLGMGLKFDGGMRAEERVKHVYIQSVAPDSPAQRTPTAWSGLREGDEILSIEGRRVTRMTRVDCVNTLKKAPVAIKLHVQHAEKITEKTGGEKSWAENFIAENLTTAKTNSEKLRNKNTAAANLAAAENSWAENFIAENLCTAKTNSEKVMTENLKAANFVMTENLKAESFVMTENSKEDNSASDEKSGAENSSGAEKNLPPGEYAHIPESPPPVPPRKLRAKKMSPPTLPPRSILVPPLTSAEENVEAPEEPEVEESDDTCSSSASTVIERMCATNNVYFLLGAPALPPPIMDRTYSLRVTEKEREEGPPPIPPRKAKLAKSNSYAGQSAHRKNGHFTTSSDDWSEDDVTLSIVGNLLQELEQLPQFSRPNNVRSSFRGGNLCEEVTSSSAKWSKSNEINDQVSVSSSCVQVTCERTEAAWNLADLRDNTAAASPDEAEVLIPPPPPEVLDSIPVPLLFEDQDNAHASDEDDQEVNAREQQIDIQSTDAMANEVLCTSPFLPVYSRLPPDGHEFPSTYLEHSPDAPPKPSEHFLSQAQLIQPPADFQDHKLNSASALFTSSANSGSEDEYDELPPPPAILPPPIPSHAPPTSSQRLLLEIVNEPMDFDHFDDEEDEEMEPLELIAPPQVEYEEEDEEGSSDRDEDMSPPPIPPKRLSSTTSSSSTSTEKTVIAVPTSPPALPPHAAPGLKNGTEMMSVRDKIALFTAKVELEIAGKNSRSSVSEQNSNEDDEEEDEEDDEDEEEEEEEPVTTIEVKTKSSESLGFGYSSIDSERFADRPSSSLSASSNFSKSSDDLLGQDVDSSDLDDNHHQQMTINPSLLKGSSLSLDRRSFYSSKYFQDAASGLDLGVPDSKKSSTLDGGSKTQSMYAILESRKSTVSKLKGLVIPAKPQKAQVQAVSDLPLIFSRTDSILRPAPNDNHSKEKSVSSTKVAEEADEWVLPPPPPLPKTQPPNTLDLQVITITPPPPLDFDDRSLFPDTEDQESGISSIESPNVSIHNTPPASPKEKPHRRHRLPPPSFYSLEADDEVEPIVNFPNEREQVVVSNSSSMLTAESVEAINRKNVMESSRSSCGRNEDVVDAKTNKLFSKTTVSNGSERRWSQEVEPVVPKKSSPVSDERWMELEKKYGGSNGQETAVSPVKVVATTTVTNTSPRKSSLTLRGETTPSPKGFKAISDTWKQRTSSEETCVVVKTTVPVKPTRNGAVNATAEVVTKRERSAPPVSRPTSLIETDSKNSKVWAVEPKKLSSPTKTMTNPPLTSYNKNNRSTSVNDLRQMFEKPSLTAVPHNKLVNRVQEVNNRRSGSRESSVTHIRMSSLDSTASESEPGTPVHYGSATSLGSGPLVDHYGSITSLASSTSLISPQELQQLIEEANQSLEESGTPSHEITVVVLQREIAGGSIGITLAGGADYDSKEITVNKVLMGSLADRDGRIHKGDRLMSINGKNLKGLTHREALCILKAPRSDCVLVLSRNKSSSSSVPPDVVKDLVRASNGKAQPSRNALNSRLNPPSAVICTKPEIAYCPADKMNTNGSASRVTIEIMKDSSGLGFSLDGGKDSPQGDRPLTIKKIFSGTSADKNPDLCVGQELLSINGVDVTQMARIEAWSLMKKLSEGVVSLVVNRS